MQKRFPFCAVLRRDKLDQGRRSHFNDRDEGIEMHGVNCGLQFRTLRNQPPFVIVHVLRDIVESIQLVGELVHMKGKFIRVSRYVLA